MMVMISMVKITSYHVIKCLMMTMVGYEIKTTTGTTR